ncbi:unnamed protein product, partial [Phaeothamnion confervicola]
VGHVGEPARPAQPPFTVDVVRSAKRRKSVGAQLRGGVLTVTVPSWMSKAEERRWAATMTDRFARSMSTERIDLPQRASALARRHRLTDASDIRWASDMTARWGSCTPTTGEIRISDRLAAFPDWVLDYVIVHELAHIEVPSHSPAFWALVRRYPKAERAIGFLIAKSADGVDEPPEPMAGD